MRFTDRFIKLPIKVYGVALKELTGKMECEDSWLKILPDEIAEYKPSIDDETGIECVHIKMKNGDQCYVYLRYTEFELVLNNHYDNMKLNAV